MNTTNIASDNIIHIISIHKQHYGLSVKCINVKTISQSH